MNSKNLAVTRGSVSKKDDANESDPFSRAEITRPDPSEPWNEDTWYTKIDNALNMYTHAADRLRLPCIDPLTIVTRRAMLEAAAQELARLGVSVEPLVGRA